MRNKAKKSAYFADYLHCFYTGKFAMEITDYVVPAARLHYFEPKGENDTDGMPYRDATYPRPCDWIIANASRFYFTNKQIIESASPEMVRPYRNRRVRLRMVYFLILNGEIVYVGQSVCGEKRMGQHRENGMRFDSVTWF